MRLPARVWLPEGIRTRATRQRCWRANKTRARVTPPGIVDVTEYGVRGKRGDFEPLISEDLFYRAQRCFLAGCRVRLPSSERIRTSHYAASCAARRAAAV